VGPLVGPIWEHFLTLRTKNWSKDSPQFWLSSCSFRFSESYIIIVCESSWVCLCINYRNRWTTLYTKPVYIGEEMKEKEQGEMATQSTEVALETALEAAESVALEAALEAAESVALEAALEAVESLALEAALEAAESVALEAAEAAKAVALEAALEDVEAVALEAALEAAESVALEAAEAAEAVALEAACFMLSPTDCSKATQSVQIDGALMTTERVRK
jgi:hypothetical protein